MNQKDIEFSRAEILKKAVAFFKKMPGVKGVFLAGSLATKHFDTYSDIDLRVIIDHQLFSSVIARKKEYPANFGELLFNEYAVEIENICVSHFKPFNKLDIVYLQEKELVPNYWYSLPIKIFYDPFGIINTCLTLSRSISWEAPTDITPKTNNINIDINKTIAYLFEVLRKLIRKDICAAKSLLICVFHSYVNNLFDLNNTDDTKKKFIILIGTFLIQSDFNTLFVAFKQIAHEIYQFIVVLDNQYALRRDLEKDSYSLKTLLVSP